jgi:hypothetical protein
MCIFCVLKLIGLSSGIFATPISLYYLGRIVSRLAICLKERVSRPAKLFLK